jgi:hypothetical protein
MRVTVVVVRLLLGIVACGLLCGVAGATTYYWISPNTPDTNPPPGGCQQSGWGGCTDWVSYPSGYHWQVLEDHNGVTPPPPNNFIGLDHGTLNVWYPTYLGACLRDDALNAWPTGCLNTYNMAQMGASRNYTTAGQYAGRDLDAAYVDWNGWWRTDVSESFGPFDQQADWRVRPGPLYEFQSGTYATSPTGWDLTARSKIAIPDFWIQSRRVNFPPYPSPASTVRCDEVWVKVWNRDASWPATAEPPTSALKYFYPSGDTSKQWLRYPTGGTDASAVADHDGYSVGEPYVYPPSNLQTWTDTYGLATDIPVGDLTSYNRMQLVALLSTNNQTANFRATYYNSEGHGMADLDLRSFNTSSGITGVYRRGPIVRFPDGWTAGSFPLSSLIIESNSPNLRVYEIYVRVWNAT